MVYNERYTRDAIVRQDKRYGEAVARIAALEQEVSDHRQRVIHLQSLLDEDQGDRPSAQRSIDDQHLIDSLERQLFTRHGECADLMKQAERLRTENERYHTDAQHHHRNMRTI